MTQSFCIFTSIQVYIHDYMFGSSFNNVHIYTHIFFFSNPQAKSGFAPFCIGLIVFSLSMFGGSSGIAMNPVRMLGPALFAGEWDYFYIYTIGTVYVFDQLSYSLFNLLIFLNAIYFFFFTQLNS